MRLVLRLLITAVFFVVTSGGPALAQPEITAIAGESAAVGSASTLVELSRPFHVQSGVGFLDERMMLVLFVGAVIVVAGVVALTVWGIGQLMNNPAKESGHREAPSEAVPPSAANGSWSARNRLRPAVE